MSDLYSLYCVMRMAISLSLYWPMTFDVPSGSDQSLAVEVLSPDCLEVSFEVCPDGFDVSFGGALLS